jgi:hypothetical protein
MALIHRDHLIHSIYKESNILIHSIYRESNIETTLYIEYTTKVTESLLKNIKILPLHT